VQAGCRRRPCIRKRHGFVVADVAALRSPTPGERVMSPSASSIGLAVCALASPLAFAAGLPTDDLDEVVVAARRHGLVGKVESSTQGTVTRAQLETRPVLRTGELLETVPGLVVTQHSGDGKANQYFLRGFNLDHGTDLATSVDGIPANMHTHG